MKEFKTFKDWKLAAETAGLTTETPHQSYGPCESDMFVPTTAFDKEGNNLGYFRNDHDENGNIIVDAVLYDTVEDANKAEVAAYEANNAEFEAMLRGEITAEEYLGEPIQF